MFNPVNLPRQVKAWMVFFLDVVLIPLSLWSAFGFRLGTLDPTSQFDSGDLIAIILLSIVSLSIFRLYKLKLHAFDISAIARICYFSLSLIFVAAIVDFFAFSGLPRSVGVLYAACFLLYAVIARIFVLKVLRWVSERDQSRIPVAIYGAGAAGVQLAAALKQTSEFQPICFVDDNISMTGLIVSGLEVKKPSSLNYLVESKKIKRILVAIPSLSGSDRIALFERFSRLNCEVQIMPSYVELISGHSTVSDLRVVSPEDLLGRDKIELDNPEILKSYAGRNIMVTGAGGSIGSELCRQLFLCSPRKIILFERSEHQLYEIDSELSQLAKSSNIEIVRCLASITDRASLDSVIQAEQVDVILHAAAYKHVPLVEENEVEGARNNILGTFEVADAARTAGIERFILISTDKAVRPTNVMGATKRIAELIIQDLQSRKTTTKFSMVRFGNVLGSSGSVVPLFNRQIEHGGPVTVTHADVTRYFMTIPEAARLVLLAGSFSRGDDLFVLDMGKPVKIIDLAKKMIELANRTVKDESNPEGDIEIEITGLRPGEKLYEELLIDGVSTKASPHEKIFRATETSLSEIEVAAMLRGFRKAVASRDKVAIKKLLGQHVESYGIDVDAPAAPVETIA